MSEKRKQSDYVYTEPNKRTLLTLDKKINIIKNYENDASFAKISRKREMNGSSERCIKKKKEICAKNRELL